MTGTLEFISQLHEKIGKKVSGPLRANLMRVHTPSNLGPLAPWSEFRSLGLNPDGADKLHNDLVKKGHVIVAEFDQDGFLKSAYGPIAGRIMADEQSFHPRRKLSVSIVASSAGVAIKKEFGRGTAGFVRELNCLFRLRSVGCRVPGVIQFDPRTHTVLMTYVRGQSLRDKLAQNGARILDRDCPPSPRMTRQDLHLWRIVEARDYLAGTVSVQFIEDLAAQLACAHAAGVIWSDIKHGNVIIGDADKKPWLIDFERARWFSWKRSPVFRHLAQKDLARFDQVFGWKSSAP